MRTTVLVIEDGRVDFETVRAVLSSAMHLHRAGTLAEGVAAADQVRPDCVLLDLGLPDSDGVETFTRFHAAHEDLPVVVLTGRDDNELGRQVVQLGAQDFLSKGGASLRLLGRTIRHAIERSENRRELLATRQLLVQAQRIDAFGQLASGMAHDFNNLLAVISTTAELAMERDGVDAELAEDFSDILSAADRGRRLVSQLLTFARRRPGKPKKVRLGAQVQSMQRILERTIGGQVRLEVRVESPDPVVRIDPGLFDQVLLNLVVNARDAMPGGGCIVVEVRATADGLVWLTVEDSGIGMTDEQLKRAIEPFFTTKSSGNGLGLSMCFGIIEQAGGQLEIVSRYGEGTSVHIRLPAEVGEVETAASKRRTKRSAHLEGVAVLLVEDLSSLRRVLRRVLRRAKATVMEASDGRTAMELFERPDRFDVAVFDVSLPHMSGTELATVLQDDAPGLPVILMTGGGLPEGEPLSANVVEVLEKPFTPDVLVDAIDRACVRGTTED